MLGRGLGWSGCSLGEDGVDRRRFAGDAGDRREQDRQGDEQAAEDRGGAGQEVGRAARGHQPGRGAADAKAAALRTLHEDHRDKRGGDQRLDDQQEGEHRWLGSRAWIRMVAWPLASARRLFNARWP